MKVNEIISEGPKRDLIKKGVGKAVQWFKNRDLKRAADAERAARNKTKLDGLTGRARRDALAKRAAEGIAARKAAEAYSSLDEFVDKGVKILGITTAIITYYQTCKQAEEEYNLYKTDREKSEYSAAKTEKEAYKYFQSDCELATGLLATEIAVLLVNAPGGKLLNALTGKWGMAMLAGAGAIGGFAAGQDLTGAAAGAAAGVGSGLLIKKKLVPVLSGKKVDAAVKASVVAWLATDEGREWIKNSIMSTVLRAIGREIKPYLDAAAKALKSYEGFGSSVTTAAGNVISPGSSTPPPPKSQAEIDQERQDAADAKANAGLPYSLQSYKENGVTYIGGKAVTDTSGNLLPGLQQYMNQTAVAAKQLGVDNPFDKIRKPLGYKSTAY